MYDAGAKEAHDVSGTGKRSLVLISAAVALVVVAAVLFWPGQDAASPGRDSAQGNAGQNGSAQDAGDINRSGVGNPLVTIETDSGAKIEIELYPDIAPN